MTTGRGVTIIANGFQEDYIINLVNSLAQDNQKVEFIASSIYPKEKIEPEVDFINLRGSHDEDVSAMVKTLRILKYYFKLLRYALKTSNKNFHIQWLRFFYIDGIFIVRLLQMFGKHVIYTAHDPLPHMKETKLNRIIFKRIYKAVNQIIVHTEFIKKRLVEEFGIKAEKIHVVKHGVYEVTEERTNIEEVRSKLEIAKDDFTILFFGKITEYKGIPLLLEAFEKLEKDVSNVKLIIAGKVELVYQEEFAKIKETVKSKNISLFLKFLSDEEVADMFYASNLIVLPYLDASQSGVMFMSYAYGTPVIAPNYGGFPYDIIKGKTGDLFERANSESLFLKLKEYQEKFVGNNFPKDDEIKAFAKENYSWKGSAEALRKIYVDK